MEKRGDHCASGINEADWRDHHKSTVVLIMETGFIANN